MRNVLIVAILSAATLLAVAAPAHAQYGTPEQIRSRVNRDIARNIESWHRDRETMDRAIDIVGLFPGVDGITTTSLNVLHRTFGPRGGLTGVMQKRMLHHLPR